MNGARAFPKKVVLVVTESANENVSIVSLFVPYHHYFTKRSDDFPFLSFYSCWFDVCLLRSTESNPNLQTPRKQSATLQEGVGSVSKC